MSAPPHPSERMAARYLQRRGWHVLARNWRGGGGELDLVVERGRTLAFVEVKARTDDGALAEPIRWAQAQRIRRAATAYLARHPEHADREVRLDLVTVHRTGPLGGVRHIPHGAGSWG